MKNLIIIAVLILIVGVIIWFLYRSKKSGATCIGCPHSKQCGGKCGRNCGSSK